jgi:hypothetical protein
MGRKESEISDSAMLIYPAQSADVFQWEYQRTRWNGSEMFILLQRQLRFGHPKPVAIHHHLYRLLKPDV